MDGEKDMLKRDIVIIGGGPAGMAAAVKAKQAGANDVLIIDREKTLGGILNQCIHNGFGLKRFSKELTGPEFAYELEKCVKEEKIDCLLDTMVTDVTKDKVITATNEKDGVFQIEAKAIILAMGCRERSRGALAIPGTRPAGVFTAGSAQKYINLMGYLPGRNVLILGSGDIGLIMARRMTLEGANVKAVCEIMPYSAGLTRNIVQCLDDYNIPLKLSHTITEIHGKDRVEGVTISAVDEKRQPIAGTEEYIECDTVLLSVGLIPENELSKRIGVELDPVTNGAVVNESRETNIPGIFACGNVLHVHDLADFAAEEAEIAGEAAVKYICGISKKQNKIDIECGNQVRYVVPQSVTADKDDEAILYFRVANIVKNATIVVRQNGKVLFTRNKKKLVPSEMEMVKISGKVISSKGKICVEVKEA